MPRRNLAALLLALALLGLPAPARAQRADGLDQPLMAANLCGPGDGGETHFTIAATGDTFPHENIQAVGEAQGYDVLFDYVRPFLQAADLAYTNFDGAMLEGSGYTGYPNFNFNPALATALKNAGIGLVSTANNHILDRGSDGLDATIGVLDANGILHHGAVRSDAAERPPYLPVTLTRGEASVTIGFLSATWGTNGIPDPFNQVNLLYEGNSYGGQGGVRQSVLDAVALAAAETDLVVVAAHWGYEYQFYPHESQLDAARRLAEAGADVILGAQPHTLQPVDILDVGGRKALVIYSLANFLASQGAFQAQSYAATATIFYVGIARGADGEVRVTGYRYLPTIHVDGDTRPAPIQPGSYDDVIGHVRTILRDPGGARQLPAEPPAPGAVVEVCPPLTLAEAPDMPITGDFAQHYAALGGTAPRPLTDGITVLGLPLGPARVEPAGDCATQVPVLYTERQRLELHGG
ncbi:MAG TPA: CapA family protein, partial [Chloroflexaceae bacterium]|nr:CapA family protein [Chloroflexaceae bacterium]